MEKPISIESDFCKSLTGVTRILETPYYRVWGCAPIWGEDGKVHVYYSRWIHKYAKPIGWLISCEIAHAVGDSPEGPFTFVDVALEGRGGDNWDSWSIHNPSVYKIGDQFVLLYMGTDGSKLGIERDEFLAQSQEDQDKMHQKLIASQRVGMAIADSANGPWRRVSDARPMVEAGPEGEWDDGCTTNPAFVATPEGKFYLYYKALDSAVVRNRRYGVAIADELEGPYVKYEGNPVIDFSCYGPAIQCEDAYMWIEDGIYKSVMRGMGVFGNAEDGVYVSSADGLNWTTDYPEVAFWKSSVYFPEEAEPLFRPLKGRFERPQILFNPKTGKPDYLYCSLRGGIYNSASGAILKINM
ncbi:glycoside hydrolase family protein [Candidatus Epulonipiscium viviparus]|uniref:glycoside hydrolase family protein n=1 Tax=Candidatus Epulonipiscium viviparus TaxID=420336 RepID=UPI00273811BF|nr:glycoside hydrolase family protein [Candidatus Epulopiscium viviparus]